MLDAFGDGDKQDLSFQVRYKDSLRVSYKCTYKDFMINFICNVVVHTFIKIIGYIYFIL